MTSRFLLTGGGSWEDGLGFGRGQKIGQQEGEGGSYPEQRILVPKPQRQVSCLTLDVLLTEFLSEALLPGRNPR